MLAGGTPDLLSTLGLQNDTQKYRCLSGGGEASRATGGDSKLFQEVCIAMRVSVHCDMLLYFLASVEVICVYI